ncbi:uncharacterized protein VTP21DRAFT_8327 [Calcarisporiella thermophila]|uniref:uncharacterized protein n=1 Tax=Calcarisporiella thermophila TaxID=911321 RepID=UPI003742C59D
MSSVNECLETLTISISSLYKHPSVQDAYLSHFKEEASNETLPPHAPETVKTVEKACREIGLKHFKLRKVESDYYEWELQRRAFRLLAPSKSHLCKSVVMEDKKDMSSPTRYFCVITQYVQNINIQKLNAFIHKLEPGRKTAQMRLVSAELSYELTGFDNNGVCPIGMKKELPIILSESIARLQPPVLWLGGGDVDWKLCLPVEDFIRATNCYIVDLS